MSMSIDKEPLLVKIFRPDQLKNLIILSPSKTFQNLVQPGSTNQLTKPRVKFVRREVSVLLPVLLPVQNVLLGIKLTLIKLSVVSFQIFTVDSRFTKIS